MCDSTTRDDLLTLSTWNLSKQLQFVLNTACCELANKYGLKTNNFRIKNSSYVNCGRYTTVTVSERRVILGRVN